MKKLKERREEQQVVEQQANELMMIQMMPNMFQGHNLQPQSQPTTPSSHLCCGPIFFSWMQQLIFEVTTNMIIKTPCTSRS